MDGSGVPHGRSGGPLCEAMELKPELCWKSKVIVPELWDICQAEQCTVGGTSWKESKAGEEPSKKPFDSELTGTVKGFALLGFGPTLVQFFFFSSLGLNPSLLEECIFLLVMYILYHCKLEVHNLLFGFTWGFNEKISISL